MDYRIPGFDDLVDSYVAAVSDAGIPEGQPPTALDRTARVLLTNTSAPQLQAAIDQAQTPHVLRMELVESTTHSQRPNANQHLPD